MDRSSPQLELLNLIKLTTAIGNDILRRELDEKAFEEFLQFRPMIIGTAKKLEAVQGQSRTFNSLVEFLEKVNVEEFHFDLLERILYIKGNLYSNPPFVMVSNKPGEVEKRYIYEVLERLRALQEVLERST